LSLTRLFVHRPTLVFVLVALMLFAGVLSTFTIVKQLFPNVDQPTVSDLRARTTARPSPRCATTSSRRSNRISRARKTCKRSARRPARPSDDHRDVLDHLGSRPTSRLTQKAHPVGRTRAADEHHAADDRRFATPANRRSSRSAMYSQKLSPGELSLYAHNVIVRALEQLPASRTRASAAT
jgi:hypothetical protein